MSARVCFRSTDSDCFSGLCHKGCSHRMWVCDKCGFEGGWGAPRAQLQEWADAHECPPVSTHEERTMTDYTPMNANDTITVMRTYQVTREGNKFAVSGWSPRTRDEWAQASASRTDATFRDVARAMVEYIDALPENHPKNYGFLGTLEVGGREYDVIRLAVGLYAATSRVDGDYLKFQHGRYWTFDWSEVLAAGKFTPRSDA